MAKMKGAICASRIVRSNALIFVLKIRQVSFGGR